MSDDSKHFGSCKTLMCPETCCPGYYIGIMDDFCCKEEHKSIFHSVHHPFHDNMFNGHDNLPPTTEHIPVKSDYAFNETNDSATGHLKHLLKEPSHHLNWNHFGTTSMLVEIMTCFLVIAMVVLITLKCRQRCKVLSSNAIVRHNVRTDSLTIAMDDTFESIQNNIAHRPSTHGDGDYMLCVDQKQSHSAAEHAVPQGRDLLPAYEDLCHETDYTTSMLQNN